MFELEPHQDKALESFMAAIEKGGKVVYLLARNGDGRSTVICQAVARLGAAGGLLVARRVLQSHWIAQMERAGVKTRRLRTRAEMTTTAPGAALDVATPHLLGRDDAAMREAVAAYDRVIVAVGCPSTVMDRLTSDARRLIVEADGSRQPSGGDLSWPVVVRMGLPDRTFATA